MLYTLRNFGCCVEFRLGILLLFLQRKKKKEQTNKKKIQNMGEYDE